jgi:hypothetical protein
MWVALAATLLLPPQVAEGVPSGSSAKVWLGRNADYEQFLRTAKIERVEAIPVGVTKPQHAFFEPGGLAAGAVLKSLRPGIREGYWESYRSEIAAYELDRLLEMDMVPPTVERRLEGDPASAQLWVEGCRFLKDLQGQAAPNPMRWLRQVWRQRVFDGLIGNIDRNAGNLFVDPEWNLILIDHSRAFSGTHDVPFEKEMAHIDRPFYERIKALDEASLTKRVLPWLASKSEMHVLLKRRDKIVQIFERLAATKGEDAAFVP